MEIGNRLRRLRKEKNFSQGTIEERSGLLRCYVSQVENGHIVPTIQTLEKFARALEVPMYSLFYDGEQPPKIRSLPKLKEELGASEDARYMNKMIRLLSKMPEKDRKLIFALVRKVAKAEG